MYKELKICGINIDLYSHKQSVTKRQHSGIIIHKNNREIAIILIGYKLRGWWQMPLMG